MTDSNKDLACWANPCATLLSHIRLQILAREVIDPVRELWTTMESPSKISWTEAMIPSKTHSFLHCLGFNFQRTQGSMDLHAQCSTHQPEMVSDNDTNTRSSLSLKNCTVNIDFEPWLLRKNPSNVDLRSLDLNTMVCHLKLLQKPPTSSQQY